MSGGSDSISSRVPLVVAGLLGVLGALAVMWGLAGPASRDVPADRPRPASRADAPAPTVAPRSPPERSSSAPSPRPTADLPLVTQLNTVLGDHLDAFYADCIDAHVHEGETAVNAREVAPGVYGPFPVEPEEGALHSTAIAGEDGLPVAWIEIAFDPGSHTARCTRHDDLVSHTLPSLPADTFQVVQNGEGCPLEVWSFEDAPLSIPMVPGSCTISITQRGDTRPRRYVSDGQTLIREDAEPPPWLQPDGPTMSEHFAEQEARWLAAIADERHDPASRALTEELARERFTHFEDVQWRDHQRQVDAVHRAQLKARIPRSDPPPPPVERYDRPVGDDGG